MEDNKNNKKTELSDDQLDEVSGGRSGFDGGSTAQATTVPTVSPIFLHPVSRPEEDENMHIIPLDTLGRL